ncbi:hypothetical protein [Thiohalocapsa marina]|nr:hypothetical protein [Thiohalocapsa marina]
MPLPGALDLLQRIGGLPHVFVTNNPRRTPEEVAEPRRRRGHRE